MEQYWKWFVEVVTTKYTQFDGRAHREEYWGFFLVYFVIYLVLLLLGKTTGLSFIGLLFSLGTLLPSLAAGARRLHDTDRTGWWQLICIIPILGVIVLLVLLAQEGQAGENQYGADPRQPAA
ncbi:MAG: DUF805 domain-containing protein [Elusimicrobiota bacterium]|nr:DUF805 domain-containing protein [Elusimicrobiota bacterium]